MMFAPPVRFSFKHDVESCLLPVPDRRELGTFRRARVPQVDQDRLTRHGAQPRQGRNRAEDVPIFSP